MYSHLEHLHTKPNEAKCIRHGGERGMPNRYGEEGRTRAAIEGAET